MSEISVIGCGRWGTFLACYAAKYGNTENVKLYGRTSSPRFQELKTTRKNSYLTLHPNIKMTDKITEALESNIIIISVGCQNLRTLAKELNTYNLKGKTFVLAMKGLEEPSATILSDVIKQEIKQSIHVAIMVGPGHVQDCIAGVPTCMIVDSEEEATKDCVIKKLQSKLIRFYYGSDFIGNQVGAALKNPIGIAAGILDGLEWYGLKGALMARAPVEVGRLIGYFGGNPMTAYSLSHLGDYEATLFSEFSHNRKFGEMFSRGKKFEKLAEGYYTLKAVKIISDKAKISMPICQALYQIVYENADIKETIKSMFERDLKHEFENNAD